MSAVFAAASSTSRFAPSSLACRKLMIDAKPNFLISGTAVALIAPEQATVVSRRWKFVMPSTVSLVTSCARTGVAASQTLEIKAAAIRNCDFIGNLLWRKVHYPMNASDKPVPSLEVDPSFSQTSFVRQVFSSTGFSLWGQFLRGPTHPVLLGHQFVSIGCDSYNGGLLRIGFRPVR